MPVRSSELMRNPMTQGSNNETKEQSRRECGALKLTRVLLGSCILAYTLTTGAQNLERNGSRPRPVGERVHESVRRIRSAVEHDAQPPHTGARRPAGRADREYGAEVKRRVERTFRVSARPRIVVRNEYGNLRIRPTNKDEVTIRVELTARAREVAQAKQLAQDTEVDVQSSPQELTIQTRYPSTQRMGPVLLQSDYDVEVPAKSELHIENRFGDIQISDIEGNIESLCRHGETRLSNVKGDLNVIAENGGVSGQNLTGTTRVDAQFGRVDLQEVSGPTTVHSRYGAVIVKSASTRNSIHIWCDTEDTRLILPPDADPNMSIRTRLGKIYSEIPLDVQTIGDTSTARRISSSPQRIDVFSSMGSVAVTIAGEQPRTVTQQPGSAPRRIEHGEVNLAPGSLVKVENTGGSIKISASSRNVLAVAATADAPEQAQRIEVTVEQMPDGGQTAHIRPAAPSGADLDIKVPERTNLEIKNSQGDIVVDSVNGRLTAVNDGGNIKILNLKPIRHECSLQATNGNISMLIPPGSHAEISAFAEDGSIDSAIPLEGQVGRYSSSLRGTVGNGTTRVELRAIHGRVVIN